MITSVGDVSLDKSLPVRPRRPAGDLLSQAEAVAAVASRYADAVDRESRHPLEAHEELRRQGLLGALVPSHLGGLGANTGQIANAISVIAKDCAATAMLLAMHQIKVASLVAFGQEEQWPRQFLCRIASEQLLVASATTESDVGGDVRNSLCAIIGDGDYFRIEKPGTVISYGKYADAILITARRHPNAASSDQVLVAILRCQYELEQTGTWDTLGMRGTCSDSFTVRAHAPLNQVLSTPFADIAAQSMLPMCHILWSSVWFGIAAGAVMRAESVLRDDARKQSGKMPPATIRLTQTLKQLQQLRSNIVSAIELHSRLEEESDGFASTPFVIAMNNLKTGSSQAAVDIVLQTLQICGIRGYRNSTPSSIGRSVRDILSAPLMINNDRIDANSAGMQLACRETGRLFG